MLFNASKERGKERARILVEKARSLTSSQTRFIQVDDRICLLHQFCFALALCQLKQKEEMLEAASMIQRLLHFQNAEGGFPRYLHEYPFAYSKEAGVKIYLALGKIIRFTEAILQKETLIPWKKALNRLEKFLDEYLVKKSPEAVYSVLFSVAKAYYYGRDLTEKEEAQIDNGSFLSARDWAEYLLFVQALDQPPSRWMQRLRSQMHPSFGYIGLLDQEREVQGERECTYLDLYFYSAWQKKESPFVLESALLQGPHSTTSIQPDPEGILEKSQVEVDFAILKRRGSLYVFTEKNRLFCRQKDLDWEEGRGVMTYTEFDPKALFVQEIFWSHPKRFPCYVNGEKASFFRMKDTLSWPIDGLTLHIRFEVLAGKGEFTGHILQGISPMEEDAASLSLQNGKIGIKALRFEPGVKLGMEAFFTKSRAQSLFVQAEDVELAQFPPVIQYIGEPQK